MFAVRSAMLVLALSLLLFSSAVSASTVKVERCRWRCDRSCCRFSDRRGRRCLAWRGECFANDLSQAPPEGRAGRRNRSRARRSGPRPHPGPAQAQFAHVDCSLLSVLSQDMSAPLLSRPTPTHALLSAFSALGRCSRSSSAAIGRLRRALTMSCVASRWCCTPLSISPRQ